MDTLVHGCLTERQKELPRERRWVVARQWGVLPASPVSEERQERLCVEQVSLSFGGTQGVTDTRGPGLGGARAFWGAFLEELKRGR